MAVPVIMPRQGNTVETCIISKWNKKKGDKVNIGDVLFTYETDKASFDEESQAEGILLDIFFEADQEVPVLTNVCVIGQEGEDIEIYRPGASNEAVTPEKTHEAPLEPETAPAVASGPIERAGEIRISPRARRLAEKEGVRISDASASGPGGRIVEADIQKLAGSGQRSTAAAREGFLSSSSKYEGTGFGGRITTSDMQKPVMEPSVVSSGYEDVKLSNIRKVISKAMQSSLSNSAQLTLNTSFDATCIMDIRKQFKESKIREDLTKITINDILLFAIAKVLKRHRSLNAHFLDDRIRYFDTVNLGIAVDTDRGLLVPTVLGADGLSLPLLSAKTKDLAAKAQSGTILPDELTGATFTVTNLGTIDIESFTPVINPPQTGILGVNNIIYRQKKSDKGYMTYPAMGLSLTFDHRALDGAPAARFLQDLSSVLENYYVLLTDNI